MKKELSMPLFWTKWRGVDYPPLGLVTVILLCSNLCAGSIGINIYIIYNVIIFFYGGDVLWKDYSVKVSAYHNGLAISVFNESV